MYGFRDDEVLLSIGIDVIVIYLLGDVSKRFCCRNMKEWPQFLNHGSLMYFAYLLPFRSYSTFHFGWLLPFQIRGVFTVKHPNISQLHISHPQNGLPYTRPRHLSYCARTIVSLVWAVALLKYWYTIVTLRRVGVSCFSTTTADAINTAEPCDSKLASWKNKARCLSDRWMRSV